MFCKSIFIALIVVRICLAGAEGSVGHAIKHRWILERLALGPELERYPLEARMGARMVSMQIDPHGGDEGALQVLATVLNTMEFSVVPRKGIGGRQFYNVKVQMGKTTGKMGPAGLRETEAELTRGFTSVDKWLMLRNGERLLLSGKEVEMTWRRAEPRNAGVLVDILGSQFQAERELDAALERLHIFDENPVAEEEEDRLNSAAPLLEELTVLNELGALEADLRNKQASTAEVTEQSALLLQQFKSLKRNAEDAKLSTASETTGSLCCYLISSCFRVALLGDLRTTDARVRCQLPEWSGVWYLSAAQYTCMLQSSKACSSTTCNIGFFTRFWGM